MTSQGNKHSWEGGTMAATGRAIQSAGSIHVFHDWDERVGYDSGSRKRLTKYVGSIKAQLLSSHILIHSRIVNQRLATHSDRSRCEAVLQDLVHQK